MSINIRSNLSLSAAAALMGLTLAGCDSTREALGLKRNQPDEFTVIQTAPLTLPPNFNDLPTPIPGAERPQEASAREKARQAVLMNAESDVPFSRQTQSEGEDALLKKAGAQENMADIRQKVDKEANVESREQDTFIKNIVSFNKKEPGKAIDPDEERERLNNETKHELHP